MSLQHEAYQPLSDAPDIDPGALAPGREDRVFESLSSLPGGFHFAWSPPGGGPLNQGETLEKVSPDKLREYCERKQNVTFLPGVMASEWGKPGRVGDKAVETKHLWFFDLDLKDLPGGEKWKDESPEKRAEKVERLLNEALPRITPAFGECYLAVFSGGGLHLYLLARDGFQITEDYKPFYRYLCDLLEKTFTEPVKFDRSCENPGRLARLPGSTNYKNQSKPVRTRILHFREMADSSKQLAEHLEAFRQQQADTMAKQSQERAEKQQKEAIDRASKLAGRDDHTDRVRASLTFKAVFDHFGKDYRPVDKANGEKLLPSPLRDDGKNPSFYVNEGRGFWKDFGGGGQGGDLFDLIGLLMGVNPKGQDFPKVMRVAEQITGIERPQKTKKTREPEATFDEYREFFKLRLPTVRKCIISGESFIPNDHGWDNALNKVEVLKSHATDTPNLKATPVPYHFARFLDELPARLLVDIPDWDGRDRIRECAHALQVENLEPEQVEYFVKDWTRNVFRKLENSSVQNRMIIFKGKQKLGKDTWINSVIGGLGHYQTDLTINSQEKDNLAELADRLVLKVAEFERTDKADISTLKDWITRDRVTYRRPYGRASETRQVRASFIGSVNVDDFLRDHTGNRRFVVFCLQGIEWNYPGYENKADQLQILAQARHLAGEAWTENLEAEARMKAYVEAMTPANPDDEVADLFQAHLHERIGNKAITPRQVGKKQLVSVTSNQVVDILDTLSRQFKWSAKTITHKLSMKGMCHRTKNGRWFSYSPPADTEN